MCKEEEHKEYPSVFLTTVFFGPRGTLSVPGKTGNLLQHAGEFRSTSFIVTGWVQVFTHRALLYSAMETSSWSLGQYSRNNSPVGRRIKGVNLSSLAGTPSKVFTSLLPKNRRSVPQEIIHIQSVAPYIKFQCTSAQLILRRGKLPSKIQPAPRCLMYMDLNDRQNVERIKLNAFWGVGGNIMKTLGQIFCRRQTA